MRYDSGVINQANKLLEQHLYCEIDDKTLKIELEKIGIDFDDIPEMIEYGNADLFMKQEPEEWDFNPYYGCTRDELLGL
jgi:hypothetical protein